MKFQVLEPFVREGLPERPLFLIVVKGMHRQLGKKKLRWHHRKSAFYLVSAQRHHRLRAVECVGLCPLGVSRLSHLGLAERPHSCRHH
jgi:hypothetical protein